MEFGNCCAGEPYRPSGHSAVCSAYPQATEPLPCNPGVTFLPKNIYKNLTQPVNRKIQFKNSKRPGQPDSLFPRGQFFNGMSETHDAFRNRGGIQPKKFSEFVRHYHEPGLRYDRSITQTDFGPQYPRIPREEPASLGSEEYSPSAARISNVNEEYESLEPEDYYIDDEPEWNLTTEYADNYVCYQKPKKENELKDLEPVKNEIFLDRVRRTHESCPYGLPHKFFCDIQLSGKRASNEKEDYAREEEREMRLRHPENDSFANGHSLLPRMITDVPEIIE